MIVAIHGASEDGASLGHLLLEVGCIEFGRAHDQAKV